jgi:hypothetical protein
MAILANGTGTAGTGNGSMKNQKMIGAIFMDAL